MENKRTCLYDKHVQLGALMSPFAGFEMPIQYSNITDEHQAVRQHCGVFDVSHMGKWLSVDVMPSATCSISLPTT